MAAWDSSSKEDYRLVFFNTFLSLRSEMGLVSDSSIQGFTTLLVFRACSEALGVSRYSAAKES